MTKRILISFLVQEICISLKFYKHLLVNLFAFCSKTDVTMTKTKRQSRRALTQKNYFHRNG